MKDDIQKEQSRFGFTDWTRELGVNGKIGEVNLGKTESIKSVDADIDIALNDYRQNHKIVRRLCNLLNVSYSDLEKNPNLLLQKVYDLDRKRNVLRNGPEMD